MGFVSITIKVSNACLIYNIDFVIHVFFYKNHKCLINQDISQVRVNVWMQQMALNPKHTHTHPQTFPLRCVHYSAWPPLYPSLCPSYPDTPPPPHPTRGCYGPASTTLVSRIRWHTLDPDWLPAMQGWAHTKKEGKEEERRKKRKRGWSW